MKGMSYIFAFILIALSAVMILGSISLINWIGHPYSNLGLIAFALVVMTLGAALFFGVLYNMIAPLLKKVRMPKMGKKSEKQS